VHILRIARRLNPGIKIVIRVHSENEAAHFVIEGVKEVVEPEEAAARELAQKALILLGAEKEQIENVMEIFEDERKY